MIGKFESFELVVFNDFAEIDILTISVFFSGEMLGYKASVAIDKKV